MVWILLNLLCFMMNMVVCDGDVFTFNGVIGLFNLFVAGFICGI